MVVNGKEVVVAGLGAVVVAGIGVVVVDTAVVVAGIGAVVEGILEVAFQE